MTTTAFQVANVSFEELLIQADPTLLTGVPAFLGFATIANSNQKIQKLTLWTQFFEKIQPIEPSYLFDVVRGFFQNGGRVCYVVCLDPMQPPIQELEQGLEWLTALEEIDLVCAPDLMCAVRTSQSETRPEPDLLYQMQQAILEHCDRMQDRFAILDCGADFTLEAVKAQQNALSQGSLNGALYFPWIRPEHRSSADPFIPPCGHIAGIYAQSDRSIGAHKAPANYPLEGVLDLSWQLTQAEQQSLSHVNCLMAFPGRGIRVWGARSLSPELTWRYINVRRLFLTVARWCRFNLQAVAFEPNQRNLWLRIERELNAYLDRLFQQGALQGQMPQEAFYVRCNEETNPPEQQSQGIVVTEVGLAPALPNEFIVVRLIHGETGVTIAA